MQESALVIGMMLQRFRLIDHTRYKLKLKETLTIKPEGLKIKVRPRVHKTVVAPAATQSKLAGAAQRCRAVRRDRRRAAGAVAGARHAAAGAVRVELGDVGGRRTPGRRHLAPAQGFDVRVAWLDDFAGKLPTEGGVLIVCASYNGAPPDNAAAFYQWLQDGMAPDALAGVQYAVFGCGNRNWASTYQAVPRFIDDKLAEFGAQRLFARGEGDAQEDLDGQFRAWRIALWQQVAKDFGVTFDARAESDSRPRYAIDVVAGPQANPLAAVHGANAMRVLVEPRAANRAASARRDTSRSHCRRVRNTASAIISASSRRTRAARRGARACAGSASRTTRTSG